MDIGSLLQDLLEETDIPVPVISPHSAANHSPVSNSPSSTTGRGNLEDLLEYSDFIENGISQDLLVDSASNEGGSACDPCAQQGGSETATAHSTHCSKKRISFVNNCFRETNTCFMLSHEGNLYSKIKCDAYLYGQVLSAPGKGVQVYKLFWDTSSLTDLVIDESKLRCTVTREEKEMVSCLKRACLLFDETYPNGPTSDVLMVNKERVRKKKNELEVRKSRQNSQQSTIKITGAPVDEPSNTNQHITNLRMALVLGNIFILPIHLKTMRSMSKKMKNMTMKRKGIEKSLLRTLVSHLFPKIQCK